MLARLSRWVMFVGAFTFLGGVVQGLPLSAALGGVMLAQHPLLTFYRGYKDGGGTK